MEAEGVPPAWTGDLDQLMESLRALETAVAVLERADPSDDGPDVRASRSLLAEKLPRMGELLETVLSHVGASLVPASGKADLETKIALAMAASSVKALREVSRHLPALFAAVEGLD